MPIEISNQVRIQQYEDFWYTVEDTPDFAKLYHLMDAAYKDGFDYGCVRSREEAIPLGTLADMTIQELVNLIRPDDD